MYLGVELRLTGACVYVPKPLPQHVLTLGGYQQRGQTGHCLPFSGYFLVTSVVQPAGVAFLRNRRLAFGSCASDGRQPQQRWVPDQVKPVRS